MIIHNKELYKKKCIHCAYLYEGHCTKEGWMSTHHNFCLAFSAGKHQEAKLPMKVSYLNTWDELVDRAKQDDSNGIEAFQTKDVQFEKPVMSSVTHDNIGDMEIRTTTNDVIRASINKRSLEIYGIIPKSLYFCSGCESYYEAKFCSLCKIDTDLFIEDFFTSDIIQLIFKHFSEYSEGCADFVNEVRDLMPEDIDLNVT